MKFADSIFVGRTCPFCGEYHEVEVSEADYCAWQGGELIQNAMSYLSEDEREILITGICSKCWNSFVSSSEEEEEEIESEDFNLELGFDPYLGCFTDDC